MTRLSFVLVAALALTACKKRVPPDELAGNGAGSHSVATATDPSKTAVSGLKYSFSRVQFAFDSSTLDDSSKAALREGAKILQDHPEVRVEVQGHADERGTTEYNLALGDRRALAVQRYLTSLGVAPSQIKTVSYGEETPRVSGHTETAFAANRRAEFRIITGESWLSGSVN